MRRLFVLLFVLALSGCAGSARPTPSPTSTEPPPLVPPTAEYGGVEGLVYSPEVLPLANISVMVVGSNRTALTDATGYYNVLPLDPGTYTLEVNQTGYQPSKHNIAVAAGQGLRVDFSLLAIPAPSPYVDASYQRRGHLDCQARANSGTTASNPDCTEAGQQYTGAYLPPGRGANLTVGADVQAILLELQWTSSVGTVNDVLRLAVRPNDGETWKEFQGKSVLRVEMDEAKMAEFEKFSQKSYAKHGGQIFFLVYPGEAAANAGAGAGATFQQDYTLYVTIFYRMGIPAHYTRIAA
jgi:hypothetical protein